MKLGIFGIVCLFVGMTLSQAQASSTPQEIVRILTHKGMQKDLEDRFAAFDLKGIDVLGEEADCKGAKFFDFRFEFKESGAICVQKIRHGECQLEGEYPTGEGEGKPKVTYINDLKCN